MLVRIFVFLLGFGLMVVGGVYMISYLNLLTIGYNFLEYVNFIFRRIECLSLFIGMALISLAIFIPGGNHYELHI